MPIINNPRHPHYCIVYRVLNENEFSDGENEVLYEGACRKYTTRTSRTSNQTVTSQYTLSIPAIVKAKAGDRVRVDDYIGYFEGIVSEVNANNIGSAETGYTGGTDIYWNNYKK